MEEEDKEEDMEEGGVWKRKIRRKTWRREECGRGR